jgi:hypothetical protein
MFPFPDLWPSVKNSEGESKFKWFKGKNIDGSDKMQILGALGTTHVIREVDWNHYIFFEVTPVAESGGLLTGRTQKGIMDLATSTGPPTVRDLDAEIYPNPSGGNFHIRINQALESQLSLELYDLSGSLLFMNDKAMEKGLSGEIYLDASALEKGVYLIKLRTKDELLIWRLVKL